MLSIHVALQSDSLWLKIPSHIWQMESMHELQIAVVFETIIYKYYITHNIAL